MLGVLPYADPLRRRRIRRAARDLVKCDPWPQEDAITGSNLAELSLLRLLWLQQLCRRELFFRNREAAILLARASAETCLLGLYCLYHEDAVTRVRKANIESLRDLTRFLVHNNIIPEAVLDECLAVLGPKGERLSPFRMAKAIDTKLDGHSAVDFYLRFYAPTSTLFSHANGISLLRHIRPDGSLSDTPMVPWITRSAVRTADACVGIMAIGIAQRIGISSTAFSQYAEAHLNRTMAPLFVLAGRGVRNSWRRSDAIIAARATFDMRRYSTSREATTDGSEIREQRIGQGFDLAFRFFRSTDIPDEIVQIFRDHFVRVVVADIATEARPNNGSTKHR